MVRVKAFYKSVADARAELASNSATTLSNIVKIRELVTTAPAPTADIARVSAYVLLYSHWERHFVQSLALTLKVLAIECTSADEATSGQQSFWLKESPHFRSVIGTIREILEYDYESSFRRHVLKLKNKADKSAFKLAMRNLADLETWRNQPLTAACDFDELIATFSNVKKEVVELNCTAIGIVDRSEWANVDLSKLDSNVHRRNMIAHGENLMPPGMRETLDAISYYESLTNTFAAAVDAWIAHRRIVYLKRVLVRIPNRIPRTMKKLGLT